MAAAAPAVAARPAAVLIVTRASVISTARVLGPPVFSGSAMAAPLAFVSAVAAGASFASRSPRFAGRATLGALAVIVAGPVPRHDQ